ncbi:MAG: AraC family transcriptional regulator [Anaerolineae bacterium]
MAASRFPGRSPASAIPKSRAIRQLPLAQLHRLHDFIAHNLTEKLTLAQIAREMHFSPDHLARRFKVTTGQSLRQYIIACRLQRARELILTSELPIAEIALGVGFTDHSHLTRSFKERFGVTPQSARGLDPKSRDSTRQGGETTVP